MKHLIVMGLSLLMAVQARGDLTGHWNKARTLQLPALKSTSLVYLPLDGAAIGGVQSDEEYRIVRAGIHEAPFRLIVERGQIDKYPIDVMISEQSSPGDEPEEVTLNLGSRPPSRLRITLDMAGAEYRCRAIVESSQDRKQWRTISNQGRIIHRKGNDPDNELLLPFGDYQYLRIRLYREEGTLPRIQHAYAQIESKVLRHVVKVPSHFKQVIDSKTHQTILTLEPGLPKLDLEEARFEIDESAFNRTIEPQTPDQYGEWSSFSSGNLKRLAGNTPVVLSLRHDSIRDLRFVVSNGDDAPLTIKSVSLWRLARGLIFSAEPVQTYELWYGRSDPPPATYEIQRLPLTVPPAELPQVSLGTERVPEPVGPKLPLPWTEQHPGLFWSVMLITVGMLMLLIIGSMKRMKSSGDEVPEQPE